MKLALFFILLVIFLVSCTDNSNDPLVINQNFTEPNESIQTIVNFDIGDGPSVESNNIKLGSGSVELNNWIIVYGNYDNIRFNRNNVVLITDAPKLDNETHVSLVLYQDIFPSDFVLDLKMILNSQLRDVPNSWESGWILFNYIDDKNFYYFAFKTNGVELGKVFNGKQEFLITKDLPKISPKKVYRLKFIYDHGDLDIFVDNKIVIQTTIPYSYSNRIALYSEDSNVDFLNIKVFKV